MIDSAGNLRDKTILTLLSDTGMRVSELLAITPTNIDIERQEVIIPHEKRGAKKTCPKCNRPAGRSTKFCARCGTDITGIEAKGILSRTRLLSIGRQTAELLSDYLKTRKFEPDKLIFPITRQMVFFIVRNAANVIGLQGRVFVNPTTGQKHYIHPHDFRSALAVSWLEIAGSDANKQKALQDQLGHLHFDTTMKYNRLSPSKVRSIGDEVREKRFKQ